MRKRTVPKKKTSPSIHLSREGERELVRGISASLVGGMGQGMMSSIMQGDRFVQIALGQPGLYALDACGQVWKFVGSDAEGQWEPVQAKRATNPPQPNTRFGFPPPTPAPFRGAP
jgi:hypothetical protein